MASVTPKNIVPSAQITTSAATYYTAPANTRCLIKKMTVTNTTAGALTYTVYLIASGGTASDSNTITSTQSIAAHTTLEVYECEGHVLEAGGFIQALGSAATSLTFRASGVEFV